MNKIKIENKQLNRKLLNIRNVLILVGVFGIGILLLYFYQLIPEAIHPILRNIIEGFGSALIIAAISGFSIEIFIHKNIEEELKDLENGTSSALLKEYTGETVYKIINDYIIRKPFKGCNFHLTLKLEKLDNDLVKLRSTYRAEIYNVNDVEFDYNIDMLCSSEVSSNSSCQSSDKELEIEKFSKDAFGGNPKIIHFEVVNFKDKEIHFFKNRQEYLNAKSPYKKIPFRDLKNVVTNDKLPNYFYFSYSYPLESESKEFIRFKKSQESVLKGYDHYYFPIRNLVYDKGTVILVDYNKEDFEVDLQISHPKLIEEEKLILDHEGNYILHDDGLIPGFAILLFWNLIKNKNS